ncbi:MAG: MnhB domain-containing protein [Planctomycetota bacterium]
MSSLLLRTAVRMIFPLTVLFSLYVALKGHNEPGGGFIGGLIAAVALVMYRMAMGPAALHALLPYRTPTIVSVGLAIATVSAVVPMAMGYAPLRSWHGYGPSMFGEKVHLASAVVFDTGVFLVVVGISVGMITRLSEELEAQSRERSAPAPSQSSGGKP